jgi:tight adherence protein B
VVSALPRRLRAAGETARETISTEDLCEALTGVSALARAGLAGREAWAPLLGSGADDLPTWADRLRGSEAEPYARALVAVDKVAGTAGASTADLLDTVIKAMEAAQDSADARAAAVAGPKASARMLQFLPLLGLALGVAMGARPVQTLLGGGVGTAALVAGMVFLVVGRSWTGALIKRARGGPPLELIAVSVLAAALRAGLPLPTALGLTGAAWGGSLGDAWIRAGDGLARGEPWDKAWATPGGNDAGAGGWDDSLREALRLVWHSGVEAGSLLEAVSARLARGARREAVESCARLGVHLMAPLGLCYLPAFVALGLVPLLLSLVSDLPAGL